MNALRIAFFMHDLAGGGVERMRLTLIAELRARGHDVTLVLAAMRGPLVPLLPPDLAVVELGEAGMVGAIRPLARYLKAARPDLLISSLDHNNVTAMLACAWARVPTHVVICQHNALSAEKSLGWRYRIVPALYRLLQNRAHGIVAVSRGVADDMAAVAGIPRDRITPIYNPVIEGGFDERARGEAPHQWLSAPDGPVFVFAGRLTAQKDPATLLRAMALVARKGAARLIVLGQGPELPVLEALAAQAGIEDRVHFAGFQANPLPWIARATALVLSSRYEGLGNVLIEALACGTPVISTDCPHGPSEILLRGTIGRLVPVGDAEALAEAMLAETVTVRDPSILKARAAAFSAPACADAHEALFARIMRPNKMRVFGLKLSDMRVEQVVSGMMSSRVTEGVRLVVTPNLDHVRLLNADRDFAAAYRAASLVCPDGFPVLLYARLRGLALSTRVTGCALYQSIATHAGLASQKLFFVVESERTAGALRIWANRIGLASRVHLAVAPPRLSQDANAQCRLAAQIKAFSPTLLVMTLGAPASEVFVHRHRNILPPCWAICVGQAVRVSLGLTPRAPALWQGMGLEWLWRLRQEPGRLAARYLKSAAWFPVAILRDLVAGSEQASLLEHDGIAMSLHQPSPPPGHPRQYDLWVAGWGRGLVQA